MDRLPCTASAHSDADEQHLALLKKLVSRGGFALTFLEPFATFLAPFAGIEFVFPPFPSFLVRASLGGGPPLARNDEAASCAGW